MGVNDRIRCHSQRSKQKNPVGDRIFVVAAGFEGRCREAFKKGHKARRQGGE